MWKVWLRWALVYSLNSKKHKRSYWLPKVQIRGEQKFDWGDQPDQPNSIQAEIDRLGF